MNQHGPIKTSSFHYRRNMDFWCLNSYFMNTRISLLLRISLANFYVKVCFHVMQPFTSSGAHDRKRYANRTGGWRINRLTFHDPLKEACMIYLSWALNAFHHDKENGYPRQQETYDNPPPGYSRVLDARGSIQGGAVPEVRRLRRAFAFRRYRVVYYWTVRPRQRTLQQNKKHITTNTNNQQVWSKRRR